MTLHSADPPVCLLPKAARTERGVNRLLWPSILVQGLNGMHLSAVKKERVEASEAEEKQRQEAERKVQEEAQQKADEERAAQLGGPDAEEVAPGETAGDHITTAEPANAQGMHLHSYLNTTRPAHVQDWSAAQHNNVGRSGFTLKFRAQTLQRPGPHSTGQPQHREMRQCSFWSNGMYGAAEGRSAGAAAEEIISNAMGSRSKAEEEPLVSDGDQAAADPLIPGKGVHPEGPLPSPQKIVLI